MLLRRIIEHVKDQNWTAIVLDFLIVVSGVFIGIQVANWNAAQGDIKRGERYAERLIADLQIDLKFRRLSVAYYNAVDESGERTIELLAAPTSDDQELLVNAYRATEYVYNPQTRSTWDEIVSSGDLGLLPDRSVQDGLSLYFGADTADQAMEGMRDSRYRVRVRRAIPHRIQKAIRARCSDVRDTDGNVIGFSETCALGVPEEEIAASADVLRNDPDLLPDLRYHFSILNSSRLNMMGDIGIIERITRVLSGDETTEDAAS